MRLDPQALAPEVHAAVCGEDLVLLDVRRDAYACLPAVAAQWPEPSPLSSLCGLSPDAFQHLVAAGLAAASGPGRPAPPRLPRPRRDLFATPWPDPSAAETAAFWRVLPVAVAGFHRRSFAGLLRQGGAWTRDQPPEAALVRRALIFRRLLPWSPYQSACLFQAYFLLRYLRAAGLSARWVFAVATWPFGAHCWLQAGDLVLTDTADHAAGYQPILVL